jgi:group I intron endonuclease
VEGVVYVYLIEISGTGKRYVGQTRTSLNRRWRGHLANARNDRRLKSPLKAALLKYGESAFRMTVLGEYASQAETDAAEVHFIRSFGTLAPHGYNLREGGLTGAHSEASKAKLRGIKRSEATREKMRAIVKTPEWREHLAEARRGRPAHPNALKGLAIGWLTWKKPRPGEANPRALLTESDVREIRRRYTAGQGSQRALANEYGVHQVTVSALVRRRTWKHVSEPAQRYVVRGGWHCVVSINVTHGTRGGRPS